MRSTSHHLSESLLKFSSASVVEPSTLERNNDDDDARDLLKKLCLRLRTVTHHGGGDGAHDNSKRNQASPDDVANVIRRVQNMASSLKVTRKQLASWMLKSPLPPEKTGRKTTLRPPCCRLRHQPSTCSRARAWYCWKRSTLTHSCKDHTCAWWMHATAL